MFPDGRAGCLLHRKYFELCVFSQVMRELNSGDIFAEGSDQYDDPREHQVSWDEFREELPRYSELVDFSVDSRAFVQQLKDDLGALADKVDAGFPENDHVEMGVQGLILHRLEKKSDPPNRTLIDQAVTASMRPVSILDILTETEQWLDLHRLFGPLSGFEVKVDDPRKRFITTLFCYGCNLGPTQTARSVKNLSRKQVAWLTLSTILRRLCSESVKNKLYFAFRELGRVIRAMFLLRYINDPEMRQTIHAATNKSEQFNDFAKWLMFGGEVIAENIRHEQRKVIKYNQLVANMVILYNVQWMSRKLKMLQDKGLPIDAEVLQALSPYRREHINRLGSYLLDLQRRAAPLDPSIDFSFESAA